MLSNKNFMSCMLAASWPKRTQLALFSSPEEMEPHVFCSVLVILIFHVTPRHFESIPSIFNHYVKLFQGKPAISSKDISCPVHILLWACVTWSWLSHNIKLWFMQLLTIEFFFVVVLSERTLETLQTILIPRF